MAQQASIQHQHRNSIQHFRGPHFRFITHMESFYSGLKNDFAKTLTNELESEIWVINDPQRQSTTPLVSASQTNLMRVSCVPTQSPPPKKKAKRQLRSNFLKTSMQSCKCMITWTDHNYGCKDAPQDNVQRFVQEVYVKWINNHIKQQRVNGGATQLPCTGFTSQMYAYEGSIFSLCTSAALVRHCGVHMM